MRALLPRLLACRRGVSAMEFALILPLLVLFSAGTIEYSRMILLTQKLQSGAFVLADLTARDKTLSTEQLEDIFLAIDQVIRPFEFAESGHAIVTSLGADPDDEPIVNWSCGGAGELDAESHLLEAGEIIELPGDITLTYGETVIAAEVFYDFEPLFGVGLAPRTIHRFAFYKPRLGELTAMDCPA
jgi:TadE-like protein